jgi:hypothetical protein
MAKGGAKVKIITDLNDIDDHYDIDDLDDDGYSYDDLIKCWVRPMTTCTKKKKILGP